MVTRLLGSCINVVCYPFTLSFDGELSVFSSTKYCTMGHAEMVAHIQETSASLLKSRALTATHYFEQTLGVLYRPEGFILECEWVCHKGFNGYQLD